MTPHDFLLHLFCLVDDELRALGPGRLRARGPAPALADSEVIAIELAGELRGRDRDRMLFRHFRAHHRAEFPTLVRIHRTTFVRQAVNVWRLKQRLQAPLPGLKSIRLYGHGSQSPQLSRYWRNAGNSPSFVATHAFARSTNRCSSSTVRSPRITRVRRKTKYVSSVSNMQ
jgi:hypothetical protein